ncbi:hypothetical protein RGQ13_12310 [Thalassotalea psychrophila]|uniref:Uncharacterized protein n=1 Tax=Thalassotalea psychrophila TaxID=3065647 RepID=A0ABY9TQC0_9GAMM|nr:hypothetical protein RGQ13_12310 [Colwelliaceae bacterium SQ149]
MNAQYSPKQFFRKVSNKLLIDYFKIKDIDFDLDLDSIYDHEVDLIFEAFLKLDDLTRHRIESDFQRINALATDGGIIALTDEAKEFDNANFVEQIAEIYGLHNKAMWAFLDSPEYWQGASIFFQTANIPSSYWRKIKNLPAFDKPFEEIDIELLAQTIGEYFFIKEGRGKRCKIEYYKRGELDYFCAFPEDFAKTEVEWVQDGLQDLPHTMAFEIIFVYCERLATLDVYAKNNARNVPKLQQLFVQNILKSKLKNFTPFVEDKVYDLEPLVTADFNFVIPENTDIFNVQILKVHATSCIDPKSHIAIIECPDKNKNAIHERLAELNLSNRYTSEVTLKVSFFPKPNRAHQTRTFTLSMPDKCNLGNFGDELLIREMLTASGIEPQPVNMSLPCV